MVSLSQAERDQRLDQQAFLYKSVLQGLPLEALNDPNLAAVLSREIDEPLLGEGLADGAAPPGDGGLADLIGLGPNVAQTLGQTLISTGVVDYDDTMPSERIQGAADLYYICMHERIG